VRSDLKKQVEWCISVIPAAWEAEVRDSQVGGSWSETTIGKNTRPYLKNNSK
jgi:hypothetical protein